MRQTAVREPRGVREAWPVPASGRTCARGWDGWVGFRPDAEPNQTSRATLLVPAAGPWRLKCVRTDPACAGTGEAAARMPGGAPMFRAGDREAEDPEAPPCEGGLSAASTATGFSPAEATADAAPPCGRTPHRRCRPAFERLRKRPSRTGRQQTRTKFQMCQGLFSKKVSAGGEAARTPLSFAGRGGRFTTCRHPRTAPAL